MNTNIHPGRFSGWTLHSYSGLMFEILFFSLYLLAILEFPGFSCKNKKHVSHIPKRSKCAFSNFFVRFKVLTQQCHCAPARAPSPTAVLSLGLAVLGQF